MRVNVRSSGWMLLALVGCVPPSAPADLPGSVLPPAFGKKTFEAPRASAAAPLVHAEAAGGRDEGGPPPTPTSSVAGGFLIEPHQVLFAGRRSGEAYFSADGDRMMFQSERDPENPFYQIHLMELETGRVERVSPGIGKTTCAWIHPDEDEVLFASTHQDPDAEKKMKDELEFRASGKERRYSWDYDPTYELYSTRIGSGVYRRLTEASGYDAEGSWSPDGEWIVFASNRRAYGADGYEMTDEERARFEIDPASMIDIYRMRGDGTQIERLTEHWGYDGGPFFSPDGSRITWRRFDVEGETAEIWTMAADGSDKRQITNLGVMSWAPFYHPSGDYLIFTTNLHGYANFELYVVDAAGMRGPVRVTDAEGFDGLPVFTPSGDQLYWTSSRTTNGDAQVFAAGWDDAAARRALGLEGGRARPRAPPPPTLLSERRVRAHVEALAAPEMEGRLTGTRGERLATEYVAGVYSRLGLAPAGDGGTYFQGFDFVSGVRLGPANTLRVRGLDDAPEDLSTDVSWRPLAFSETGTVATASVAFAGYGIVAPEADGQPAYDAYGDLDVEGRWVMVFRYLPESIDPERRQHLARYASLRFKAMEARDRGAAGLLVVSGPTSQVKEELVPLRFDAAVSGSGVPAVSIIDGVAERLLGRSLATLQTTLDGGEVEPGFLVDAAVSGHIDLAFERARGRNVVARLRLSGTSTAPAVVVGAHVDHLGRGEAGDSLARKDEVGLVHPGADDNASGVAGLLEIATWLSEQAARGQLDAARRDVVFAAWSGEELGLFGSSHFVDALEAGGGAPSAEVVAYLNMDMIGRLEDAVIIQAIASSSAWPAMLEQAVAVSEVPVRTSEDAYLPTDATPFYLAGIPILSAFTGAHGEYHSPRDTAELVRFTGVARIAGLVAHLTRATALRETPPPYVKVEPPKRSGGRMGRVYLGTIPDYAGNAEGDTGGVPLSGVSAGSPVEKAGVQAGDVLVELAGQTIGNIYDFVKVLGALKIGEEVSIVVRRGAERLELRVTPGSRE